MHVKKGDTVYILAGKDKGKTGKVLRAFPREDKVLVEDINKKKVHEGGKRSGQKGSIVEKAFPIHISNVKLSKSEKKSAPAGEKKPSAKKK